MSKFMGSLRTSSGTSRKDTSIIDFVVGIVLMAIGIYHILKNTSVGVLWMSRLFGLDLPSGIITLPILFGIAIVFFNHRSWLGWLLIGIGMIVMLVQIILSVKIMFNTTSLWEYFLMFGGTFGGLGLLAKGLLK